MAIHIDIGDPKYRNAVAEILRRHDRGEPEANITSAVRDFLILTGLARSEEMIEENPPSDASRRAVDLTALDTFIEFKRRIGTASGGRTQPAVRRATRRLPDPIGVAEAGSVWACSPTARGGCCGGLGAGKVRLTHPYAFTLEEPDHWIALHNWLRDSVLVSLEGESPDREGIVGHFGPESPSYQRDIAALKTLYQENADLETIRIKRRLWYDLLRTALGEIAYTTEGMSAEAQARLSKVGVGQEEMDDLFVRHTYLSAVIGMVVQASFGIDIRRLAETDPADLLQGRELYRATGLQGVLESDFFAWPNEVGGKPAAANPSPPRGPVRLDRGPAGHCGHALRVGHPTGGTATAGRILHPRMAGPRYDARAGGRPAEPARAGSGLRLRNLRGRGGVPLHRRRRRS